jgi:hippurate hydrolase
MQMDLQAVPEPVFGRMVELRHAFHRHPELAFEEEDTAELIIRELDSLVMPYEYGGKGTGVVGKLHTGNDRPTIALRADMDALPGAENTDLPFASTVEGKMHACGHDAHMAILLGVAQLLCESPPEINTCFVFQSAEEKGGGARTVIATGLLDDVAAIFGGHVTHHYRVGEIMVADGVITAQSDRFLIHVRGKGGHGARPHEATDAVVTTGLLITALQSLSWWSLKDNCFIASRFGIDAQFIINEKGDLARLQDIAFRILDAILTYADPVTEWPHLEHL